MAFIGNTVQTQGFSPAIDYFNGNGVTVTFTLSRPVASVAQMIVAIDNVIQNPSSAFNVSGSSITFTSAPLSGTNNIWVEYTSLITTYAGISQDPSVIGDITATGGFLSTGDFGNSFIDGTLVDYVTGRGRVTVGELDDVTFYHGGTAGRSEMMTLSYAGTSKIVGNLGLSRTPQGSTAGAAVQLELGSATTCTTLFGQNNASAGGLMANGYLNGSSQNIYANSSTGANQFYMYDGAYIFYNAAAGTAGNPISFTERMRITSAGEVLVGTTTTSVGEKMKVAGSTNVFVVRCGNASGAIVTSNASGTASYNAAIF
jgi:hypothetical protein